LSAYGYAYNNRSSQTVSPTDRIPFNIQTLSDKVTIFSNGELRVSETGIYLVHFEVNLAASTNENVGLILNGSQYPGSNNLFNNSTGANSISGTVLVRLTPSDTMSVVNFGGVNLSLTGGVRSQIGNFFAVRVA